MNIVKLLSAIKTKKGIVILIFIAQIIFAFYISNYTEQEKNPSQRFELREESSEIVYTIEGELIALTKSGTINYYYLGEFEQSGILPATPPARQAELLWKYDMGAPISSLALSSNKNFLLAVDEEGDLTLFATLDGHVIWKTNLGRGAVVEGIGGTFGEFGASVDYQTIVVSASVGDICDCRDAPNEGSMIYVFMPQSADPIWTHESDAYKIRGAVSANGTRVATGDANGTVSYFSWKGGEPLWTRKFDYPIKAIRISYTGYRVAVLLEGGNPNIYVLDEESHRVSSFYVPTPPHDMTISFNAATVYGITGERIHVFSSDSEWVYPLPEQPKALFIPPHGDYILVGGTNYNQLYYRRSVPLWSLPEETTVFHATPNGEYVAVARGILLEIYSNLNTTPLGDKMLWGVWFLVFAILAVALIPRRHIPRDRRAWILSVAMGIAGFVAGFILTDPFTPLSLGVVCSVALLVSTFVAFSGEGAYYDLPLGWLGGTVAAAISGILVAIVFWMQGVEQPLNSEIFFVGLGALQVGAIVSVAGAFVGYLAKRIVGDRYG